MESRLELDANVTGAHYVGGAPPVSDSAIGALTLAQAAGATGLSVHALRRLIRSGQLPAAKVPGRCGVEYHLDAEAIKTLAKRKPRARVAPPVAQAVPIAAAGATATAGATAEIARVAALEEEVKFLRRQHEEKDATIRDLRALLLARREETSQICEASPQVGTFPHLPATGYPRGCPSGRRWGLPDVSPPRPEGTPAPAPRRPWWPWRRLAWLA